MRINLPVLALATLLTLPALGASVVDLPGLPPGISAERAERFGTLQAEARAAFAREDHAKGARLLRQAARIHGGNEGLWYDLACALTLTGDTAGALNALESAAVAGWRDQAWPAEDTDLTALRELPEFATWRDSLAQRGPTAAAAWPSPMDLPPPALSEEDMETRLDAWDAGMKAVRPVMGSTARQAFQNGRAAWRALSLDAQAAGLTDEAERASRSYEALRAVAGRDARYASAAAAAEILRRVEAFLADHPSTERTADVRLLAGEARYAQLSRAATTEVETKAAGAAFEREMLLLATTTPPGQALETALLRLIEINAAEPVALALHARLATVVGDDEKFRAKVLASHEARGVHYLATGLPAFSASTLDGRALTATTLPGRATLLDFWATWCGPCRAELPNLKAKAARFRPQGLEVIGISLDDAKDKTPEALKEWCAKEDMPWPQVYDGRGWKAELATTFGVQSIPFVLLVGPGGKVLAAGESLRGEELEATLARHLGAPADASAIGQ